MSNLHSQGAQVIPIKDILVLERLRQDTPKHRAYISEILAPSIAELGLMHPIVLNTVPEELGTNPHGETIMGVHQLIAGWSRLMACVLLRHETIPYVYRENLDLAELHKLEVEENIRRSGMTWQEETLGIKKVHDLSDQKAAKTLGTWTTRATGKLLNVSQATVVQALKVGTLLENEDKEILACTTFDAARQVLLKREQKKAEAKLALHAIPGVVTKVLMPAPKSEKAPFGQLSIVPREDVPSRPIQPVNSVEIPLSQMLFNDCCVYPGEHLTPANGWMSRQPAESQDLIFTDIPFGIDMGNLDIVDLAEVEQEHDVEENVAQMLPFLTESYRLLKDRRYLIFFMDLKHWEKLSDWGSDVGFDVMPYPLIWHKMSTVKNRAASKWWPKKHETLMIMAKGQATLKNAQPDSVFDATSDAERKKFGHPFAKSFDLCRRILEPVVIPQYQVLDPYMGSGSMLVAAISMGLRITGVEKKEEHFNRALLNVKEAYQRQLGTKQALFT